MSHHVSLRKMINTKRYIKWNHENRSRKSPEKDMNFQDQHCEHKTHFDYQVESVDNEHETQIVRRPGREVSLLKVVNSFLRTVL